MFNRNAVSLKTNHLEGYKYRLDFELLKDIENGVITITNGKDTLKEFALEAKTKGQVSQVIDLSGVKGKNLFWEINQSYLSAEPKKIESHYDLRFLIIFCKRLFGLVDFPE